MVIENEKVKINNIYEIDLDILSENRLTPNQVVLLNIIFNKDEVAYIKYIDIDRIDILRHDLYNLYRKDFLINDNSTRYIFKFSELNLTEKGISFLNKETKELSDRELKKQIAFDEFIDKYYKLFPEKVYTGNGLPVRSNLKLCKSKMVAFIREYKYDYDTILKATEMYVKISKSGGYGYMKTSYYFIKKDSESILESYCQQILTNKEDPTSDTTLFREL